tara:strand:- start:360 stop:596 length:237 start_codon:yes stop_codon:yes gene_type:complete
MAGKHFQMAGARGREMKLRTVGGGAPSIAHARAVDAIASEVTIVRTGARCAADFNGVRLPRSSNSYSERSCEKSHLLE